MKALVTGASGFVGRHLVECLQAQGYEVVTTGQDKVSPFGQEIEYVQIDLMNSDEVSQLKLTGVDVIFHLAGLAAVGPSFAAPQKYLENNGGIQIQLFEACLSQAVNPKFIIISSGSLYDHKASLPLMESSPTAPSSPYVVSKLTQEALALYYGSRGFDVVIARPFNHIGPGQQPGFLVSDLCKQIAELEKSEASVLQVGNLSSKRDFTDVRDIVKAYAMLADKGTPGEIYNVCSGKSTSGQDILDKLLALAAKPITAQPDPTRMRPSDIPDLYGDASRLNKDTGWQPAIPLDQTLSDTLTYWRSQV